MGHTIKGGMPKRKRNELEEATASGKKKPFQRYKMNIWNFANVSTSQQIGIPLYGVLPVRLTSHVHTVADLTVNATLRLKIIKMLTNFKQINP